MKRLSQVMLWNLKRSRLRKSTLKISRPKISRRKPIGLKHFLTEDIADNTDTQLKSDISLHEMQEKTLNITHKQSSASASIYEYRKTEENRAQNAVALTFIIISVEYECNFVY